MTIGQHLKAYQSTNNTSDNHHGSSKGKNTTEAYDKQLDDQFFNEVTLDEVNAAMREAITNKNQVLVVYATDKAGVNVPSNAQFEQMVLDAQAKTYPKYVEKKLDDKLIETLPKKGRIKSEKAGLHGTTEITLSNGVKVYFKKTDYQKDAVTLNFFAKGGSSLYPVKDLINTQFISAAVKEGGVGRFSATELNKFLAGKTIRINAGVGNETQSISGNSSIKDIRTLFELTCILQTYVMIIRRFSQKLTACALSSPTVRQVLTLATTTLSLPSFMVIRHVYNHSRLHHLTR